MLAYGIVRKGPAPAPECEADPDAQYLDQVRRLTSADLGLPWPQHQEVQRPGRPTFDYEYQQTLLKWVATLTEFPSQYPRTNRPHTWRPGDPLQFPTTEEPPTPVVLPELPVAIEAERVEANQRSASQRLGDTEVIAPEQNDDEVMVFAAAKGGTKKGRDYHRCPRDFRNWIESYVTILKAKKWTVADSVKRIKAMWGDSAALSWMTPRVVSTWLRQKANKKVSVTRDSLCPVFHSSLRRLCAAGIPMNSTLLASVFSQICKEHGLHDHLSTSWTRMFLRASGWRFRRGSTGMPIVFV